MDIKISFDGYTVQDKTKLRTVKVLMLKGEKGDIGYPTDEQVREAVDEWLDDHPEATTTVEDGSISIEKLATDTMQLLDNKANIDGSYEKMAVGTAKQLLSNMFLTDDAPYQFRTAGGALEIGDRETDMLVGVSMPWNQLAGLDDSLWDRLRSAIIASGTKIKIQLQNVTGSSQLKSIGLKRSFDIGHKVLVLGTLLKDESNFGFNIGFYSSTNGANSYSARKTCSYSSENDVSCNTIFNVVEGYPYLRIVYATSATNDNYSTINNLQAIDLTQMFGTEIADYIYSLETANAGNGVAWFKRYFPNDYYPYSAPTMQSVKASAHKMTGFNQFDKNGTLNNGYLQEDGHATESANYYYTDYIRVLPNTEYRLQGTGGTNPSMCWYDSDKNFIFGVKNGSGENKNIISPSNACYLRASFPRTNLDVFCILIHWDGERDGEYEEYKEWVYPLDSDLELRGIPKLDTDGNLVYDGDAYESDGTVTRRFRIINLGDSTWTKNDTPNNHWRFIATVSGSNASKNNNAICSKYVTISPEDVYGGKLGIAMNYAYNQIVVCDESYSDATAFKTAMSGVYLVYELATPTTESADTFTNPQIVDNWGTEEYVTTSILPIGHSTKYPPDLKAKLEVAPESPVADGLYLMRRENGQNSYSPYIAPDMDSKADVVDVDALANATVIKPSRSGSFVSFSDGANLPVVDLTVGIDAVQDLHGYDIPWIGGTGKNIIPDNLTWTPNAYRDDNGQEMTSTTSHYSSMFPVVPLTEYTASGLYLDNTSYRIYFLQADGTWISRTSGQQSTYTFTTPANCENIQIQCGGAHNLTNEGMIQLGSTATAYEPYANVCPINGWTGANVRFFDNSLVDKSAILRRTSIDNTTGEFISGTNYACSNYIDVAGINSVTVYYNKTTSTSRYFKVARYNANKELIDFAVNTTHTAVMERIETIDTSQCSYIAVVVGIVYIDSLIVSKSFNTYSISWQTEAGTVYNGTLDVTTGELVVDWVGKTLNGSEAWTTSGSGNNKYFFTKIGSYGDAISGQIVCDSYAQTSITSSTSAVGINVSNSSTNNQAQINMRPNDVGNYTITTFKEYLAQNPVGCIYQLAVPVTYQLTPTEVETLLGENNIFADCGDIKNVTYKADTKKYVDGTIVDVPLAMIAPLETGATASKDYAVGEYFILNGNQFCKALASIASGATFTLNTNYTVTTIGAELKALQ